MGLKLRCYIGAAILGGIFPLRASLANPVELEVVAWPKGAACPACLTLQFDVLEMRLPAALVDKVFVPDNDTTGLHLIPAGRDGRSSVYLMSLPAGDPAGKYARLVSLPQEMNDASTFFDQLGQVAAPFTPWATIRKIEGVDTAVRYTKATKGKLHAYWIHAAAPSSQYVYLVVDGNPLVYALAGEISPALYEAVLANLKTSPAP